MNQMRGRQFLRIKNRTSPWRVVGDAVAEYFENDLTTSAAAISYYTMLMLFPLLIVIVSVGQSIFGGQEARDFLVDRILAFLPGTRQFVRDNLESLQSISTGAIVSCSVLVLWATSWIFAVIEKAINRIWATPPRTFLRGRLLIAAMTGGMILLLGLSAIFASGISLLQATAEHLPHALPGALGTLTSFAWQVALAATSLLITIILFATIYRIMPTAMVKWIEVIPGAVISAIAWETLKLGFAFLLPRFLEEYRLFYGGAWLALVLLTWVYMSSIIMLFGAQLSAVLHCRHEQVSGVEYQVPELEAGPGHPTPDT